MDQQFRKRPEEVAAVDGNEAGTPSVSAGTDEGTEASRSLYSRDG